MTKIIVIIIIFAVLTVILSGVLDSKPGSSKMSKNVTVISPETAQQKISDNPKILIIDVRTKGEYSQGHLPKAKNIPLSSLEEHFTKNPINKDKEIILYCASGNRSRTAGKKLEKLGYTQIYDIMGGYNAWPFATQ